MSYTVRESITVDPITAERMDVMGSIHRYNFGWVKTHRIVGAGAGEGQLIETSVTGISGMAQTFVETVYQEILPPSLETPDVAANTVMSQPVKVGSYFKYGMKMRTMIRAKAVGTSEIIVMGSQGFSIDEEKEYADAVGAGGGTPGNNNGPEAAEGGITISVANGVLTKTTIKG